MRALRLYPTGLVLEDVPRPEPGPGEVLVRVLAAAITRNELTWPTDRLPAIPSYELAGVVEANGEEVIALTPFDRDGVAADYALVPETVLARRPAGLSHEEAAALPMPALSAWQGLVIHGGLKAGERVLVTGAGGGVGHVAVQLVGALGGVLVEEGEACDLLFDTAGGSALERAAPRATRVVTIAAEAPGAAYFVVEPDGTQLASLPEVRPQVDSVFPLEDFQAAFDRCAARGKHGKVVLRVSDQPAFTRPRSASKASPDPAH
jgi:NADPH:quinone reductase-like Zn-dependent oxidoreductase